MDQPARAEGQRLRERIRFKHYSLRTEQAHVDWIRRFVRFNDNRHPAQLQSADVERFLTHLAVDLDVAAATQNQAHSALLFLYREVLAVDLPWPEGVVRAKTPRRLPVVLTPDEIASVFAHLRGTPRLFAALLYGTGMRLMEGARRRVKDVDFARGEIVIRDGKGAKDRITMLPRALAPALRRQLAFGDVHSNAARARQRSIDQLASKTKRARGRAPRRNTAGKRNQSQLSAPPV